MTRLENRPSGTATARIAGTIARAIAGVALLASSISLSGCGMMLLKHRTSLPLRSVNAEAGREPKNVIEARAQSAANPRDAYWPYRLGQIYLDSDSLPSAEAALETSLSRDRTYAPALSLLSKLYFDQGRHAEAVKMLDPVVSSPDAFSNADRQALLAALALHQDALGRPDLARSAIAGAPQPKGAHASSAMVFVTLRGESPDSAGALAKAALEEDSKNAVNLNNYGITRLRAGDPAAARKAFDQAIARDPSLPGPYYNLAILEKFFLFDDAAAARWFQAYSERSKADPDSLFGVFSSGDQKHLAEKGN